MTEIYIRGPFTILCNYCGKIFGEVNADTEVAASAALQCPCGHETKFENMAGPNGVQVAPKLVWHDVGCVKRYGAVGEGGAMCACEQRRAQRTEQNRGDEP